jgi:cell division protein ZapA
VPHCEQAEERPTGLPLSERGAEEGCAAQCDGRQWQRQAKKQHAGAARVKVDIYDQSYNVSAGDSEAYVRELAAYVDAKMREVAEVARTVDSLKVAVLAALNIADELFSLRSRQQEIDGPLRKRVEKCVALVEKALEHSN